MKRAKQKKTPNRPAPGLKKRYRLANLLAQCTYGTFEWTPELLAWDEMKPVGREFGADESL